MARVTRDRSRGRGPPYPRYHAVEENVGGFDGVGVGEQPGDAVAGVLGHAIDYTRRLLLTSLREAPAKCGCAHVVGYRG